MNFLTVTQAAAKLRISSRRVRQMIAAGTIPAQRISERLYLIDAACLASVKVYRKAGRPKKC